jgi:UDP-N-acetylglucosamine--dolichyl-phosphate N-acetylglucosaminephosphotransferase
VVLISLLAPISLFGFTVSKGSIDANSIQVLLITLAISIVAFFLSQHLIDRFKDTLSSKGLFGKDLNKAGERETKEKVPEAVGVCITIVFLLITIMEQLLLNTTTTKLVEYNAALLSICMAVLLGFIDDVVDLRWSHKLIVPTIASFPLLVAYDGTTDILVPTVLRPIMGRTL